MNNYLLSLSPGAVVKDCYSGGMFSTFHILKLTHCGIQSQARIRVTSQWMRMWSLGRACCTWSTLPLSPTYPVPCKVYIVNCLSESCVPCRSLISLVIRAIIARHVTLRCVGQYFPQNKLFYGIWTRWSLLISLFYVVESDWLLFTLYC